jgi:hypothetical protein
MNGGDGVEEGVYENKLKLDYAKPELDEAALAAKRERLEQLAIRPAVTVYKKP